MCNQDVVWRSIQNICELEVSIDAFWAALLQELPHSGDRFSVEEAKQSRKQWESTANEWACVSEYKAYTIRRRSKGRPYQGYITTRLELWRVVDGETEWPYARKSLLYIGFAPPDDSFWEDTQLRLNQHGQFCGDLFSDYLEEDVRLEPQTVRFWKWVSGEEAEGEVRNPWRSRAWFFVLPLCEINDRKDIRSKIVHPIRILLGEGDPTDALEMFRNY